MKAGLDHLEVFENVDFDEGNQDELLKRKSKLIALDEVSEVENLSRLQRGENLTRQCLYSDIEFLMYIY